MEIVPSCSQLELSANIDTKMPTGEESNFREALGSVRDSYKESPPEAEKPPGNKNRISQEDATRKEPNAQGKKQDLKDKNQEITKAAITKIIKKILSKQDQKTPENSQTCLNLALTPKEIDSKGKNPTEIDLSNLTDSKSGHKVKKDRLGKALIDSAQKILKKDSKKQSDSVDDLAPLVTLNLNQNSTDNFTKLDTEQIETVSNSQFEQSDNQKLSQRMFDLLQSQQETRESEFKTLQILQHAQLSLEKDPKFDLDAFLEESGIDKKIIDELNPIELKMEAEYLEKDQTLPVKNAQNINEWMQSKPGVNFKEIPIEFMPNNQEGEIESIQVEGINAIQESAETNSQFKEESGEFQDSTNPQGSQNPNQISSDAPIHNDNIEIKSVDGAKGVQNLTANKDLSQQQLMQQVVDKIETLSIQRPGGTATIELNPQELGSISVTVKSFGNNLKADFVASNPQVQEALEKNRPMLEQAAESRGWNLSDENKQGHQQSGQQLKEHFDQTVNLLSLNDKEEVAVQNTFQKPHAGEVNYVA